MRILKISLLLGATLSLTACASMASGTTQDVQFVTPGVIGADCRAENEHYAYNIYAPMRVNLERSRLPLTVTCTAPGYETAVMQVESSTNRATYMNVLNGIIPGTAYDLGTRAAYAYPDIVEIEMMPIIVEPETIVPVYSEPVAQERYYEEVPAPVPYHRADEPAEQGLTGIKDRRLR